MVILESPDLGEPKEVWEAWVQQLEAMSQRDESVKFALKRAKGVLAEMASIAAEEVTESST